jgi:DNA-binding NtrC family response regulator
MKRIMIIDDDVIIHTLLSELLNKNGYEVVLASDGVSGLSQINTLVPDLVITDFNMPGKSGLEVVSELSKLHPGLPVILLTAYGDVPLTIKSIQAGAFDYIEKPIQPKQLLETIKNGLDAFDKHQSINKAISFPSRIAIEENLPVGKTPAMKEIFKNIGRISMNRLSVLITGEAGTGKEKMANLIHHSGITRDFPIASVNCNAISGKHIEAELFGHLKGAVPGLRGEKTGRFEYVNHGTLFLHEFCELPLNLQYQLLNVLENKCFVKPGVIDPIPMEARIIAGSSRNIEELIKQGKLLKELYYHLKIFHIHIPPLRHRRDDIPELVEHLVIHINRKQHTRIQRIEDGVFELLKRHDWPGNIRELENVLLQAILLSRSDVLEKGLISLNQYNNNLEVDKVAKLLPLEDIEKKHIKSVLDALGWRKQEAAKVLEITRPTLNAKIEKYQLHR